LPAHVARAFSNGVLGVAFRAPDLRKKIPAPRLKAFVVRGKAVGYRVHALAALIERPGMASAALQVGGKLKVIPDERPGA
jgi:hypothetical protein